ncbi:hypothetical protein DACRYDRAFT_98268 [Dacryopinax primogenitus]|uniref:Nucleoporin Nup133/Nup155-like C-terminal domain-containing protein n=1 Tax=Dacryopinax primogenitus (strain DJM 731) TaxID=1858805 RepID=M5GGJ5_DACPD|nr:uncharacterized protein DACRYDRAFT_98268 [Dacryopinax primogenitus]EJU05598.1 hypothetical protein DACRYDRAFT_98268 [Dacryopinax primogenitus]
MDVDEILPAAGEGRERDVRQMRDGEVERVLLKDDDYEVAVVGEVPGEVKTLLESINLQKEPVRGAIDDRTGFAFLTLFDRDARTHPPATAQVYTFPLPPARSGTLAHAALVPHQAREPGLLVVLPEGEARYWDSVTRALTSRDKFASVVLSLSEGEEVNGVWRWENAVFLLSTTLGNISRLMLTSTNMGRALVASSPFARPRGGLTRLFSRAQVPGSPAVVGLAVVPDPARGADVWIAKAKSVELWRLEREGGEHLVLEVNMQELLSTALPAQEDRSFWDVQLLDIAALKDGTPAVAFACTLTTPGYVWSSTKPPSYAVATLAHAGSSDLQVSSLRELQYSTPSTLPSADVSLTAPQGGTTVFVQFPDTVISFTLIPGSVFYEDIPLRDLSENRYLGHSTDSPVEGQMTCLTALSGLVSLTVNVPSVTAKAQMMLHGVNREEVANGRLKERIEHAVYYGGSSANPLSFDFRSPDIEGDLAAAIEEISTEIVSSSYKYKPVVADLDRQLEERLDTAKELIGFIDSNHLLSRLSVTARWKICMDGEKIAAAKQLWTLHEDELRENPRSVLSTVLSDAIDRISAKQQGDGAESGIRPFLQDKIGEIGNLPHGIGELVEQERHSADSLHRANITLEADSLVVTLLTAAQEYRSEHSVRYGISEFSSPVPVWTETKENIDLLYLLNERTKEDYRSVYEINLNNPPSNSSRAEIKNLQEQLKYHLLFVARTYFRVVRNCLSHFEHSQGEDSTEARNLQVQHVAQRKGIIMGLVNMGHGQAALDIAEEEKDWETLVDLCTDEELGATSALLESYILNHGEAFAFELYQRYYQTGKIYQLLHRNAREEVQLLDRFLQQSGYHRISWIHDITMGNFQLAAGALMVEGKASTKTIDRKTMLSLGKVSELAQHTAKIYKENNLAIAGRYDKGLEMVTVHETLAEELAENIALGHLAQPDIMADTIAERKAARLGTSALVDVFKAAVKHVMHGDILSIEDLVDVLTLKDNQRGEYKDYGTALKAFEQSEAEMPTARAQLTLEALWRRIYLHDNWRELKPSDDMSDVERQARLRGTAAYATLWATVDGLDPKYFLRPANCRRVPTDDECRARFENYTSQQVAVLQHALEQEIGQLEDIFTEEGPDSPRMGLEYLYDETFALLGLDKETRMSQ